jgi:Radical SAM superfamily/Iron-sulfur cluster-binding domain
MSVTAEVRVNPYLHIDENRIYNPLTDRAITPADADWPRVRAFLDGGEADESLVASGWVVPAGQDLSRQYRLKIVSLETMTACNQKCYFCPVSIAPRPDEEMPDALFRQIVNELINYRDTIEGVFLQSYNEPTIERRFVDLCSALFAARLPVAVLTNATGLTPARTDALMRAGTLRYLCVNLSTIDRQRYKRDRGGDHLDLVLRNLDYMANKAVADEMKIVVLGEMDAVHHADFEAVRDRFANARFEVELHHATDRAGWLEIGLRRPEPVRALGGCDLMGSRPLQHLHITPRGTCILCCQDYDENYIVGDLTTSTIAQVLEGDAMAKMRRWVYGVEEAPDDFICRTCVFALQRR